MECHILFMETYEQIWTNQGWTEYGLKCVILWAVKWLQGLTRTHEYWPCKICPTLMRFLGWNAYICLFFCCYLPKATSKIQVVFTRNLPYVRYECSQCSPCPSCPHHFSSSAAPLLTSRTIVKQQSWLEHENLERVLEFCSKALCRLIFLSCFFVVS